MYTKLSIPERLKDLRVERDLTLEQLAEQTGLSRSALGKYETDDYKDISPFAIAELAKFYGVSTDYLLGLTGMKNHPNADLHNLHLSDDMIDLLKSGILNHRLLCEMVTHKSFQRFLVDAEIYVDRIADMRVNDMNTYLTAARKKVLAKKHLDENSLYVRTLELAQVDEDAYYSRVIAQDLAAILKDIREDHKTDPTTADTDSPVADMQKQLEEVLHYEGSDDEKKARLYLAQLRISYDKLTPEQFVTLIDILKLSDYMKSPYNQRGKQKKLPNNGKKKKKK